MTDDSDADVGAVGDGQGAGEALEALPPSGQQAEELDGLAEESVDRPDEEAELADAHEIHERQVEAVDEDLVHQGTPNGAAVAVAEPSADDDVVEAEVADLQEHLATEAVVESTPVAEELAEAVGVSDDGEASAGIAASDEMMPTEDERLEDAPRADVLAETEPLSEVVEVAPDAGQPEEVGAETAEIAISSQEPTLLSCEEAEEAIPADASEGLDSEADAAKEPEPVDMAMQQDVGEVAMPDAFVEDADSAAAVTTQREIEEEVIQVEAATISETAEVTMVQEDEAEVLLNDEVAKVSDMAVDVSDSAALAAQDQEVEGAMLDQVGVSDPAAELTPHLEEADAKGQDEAVDVVHSAAEDSTQHVANGVVDSAEDREEPTLSVDQAQDEAIAAEMQDTVAMSGQIEELAEVALNAADEAEAVVPPSSDEVEEREEAMQPPDGSIEVTGASETLLAQEADDLLAEEVLEEEASIEPMQEVPLEAEPKHFQLEQDMLHEQLDSSGHEDAAQEVDDANLGSAVGHEDAAQEEVDANGDLELDTDPQYDEPQQEDFHEEDFHEDLAQSGPVVRGRSPTPRDLGWQGGDEYSTPAQLVSQDDAAIAPNVLAAEAPAAVEHFAQPPATSFEAAAEAPLPTLPAALSPLVSDPLRCSSPPATSSVSMPSADESAAPSAAAMPVSPALTSGGLSGSVPVSATPLAPPTPPASAASALPVASASVSATPASSARGDAGAAASAAEVNSSASTTSIASDSSPPPLALNELAAIRQRHHEKYREREAAAEREEQELRDAQVAQQMAKEEEEARKLQLEADAEQARQLAEQLNPGGVSHPLQDLSGGHGGGGGSGHGEYESDIDAQYHQMDDGEGGDGIRAPMRTNYMDQLIPSQPMHDWSGDWRSHSGLFPPLLLADGGGGEDLEGGRGGGGGPFGAFSFGILGGAAHAREYPGADLGQSRWRSLANPRSLACMAVYAGVVITVVVIMSS